METGITMVRLCIPEMTHSTRKAQLEKILQLLRGQNYIHGVMVVPCVREGGAELELHYETVGDVLRRNPDPPLVVEFFDEAAGAGEVRRLLRNLVPESHIVYWDANWEKGVSKRSSVAAATART